ncbi:MAG TPA: beta-propeller fold lactonase family protein [Solirubrobacteraceae bacterium]|nr:beta-propeller fold lactonase family protein [Solirubrobacteraceae bacterium]
MFTSTNDAGANAVLAFRRAADGELSSAGSFATGGAGTGIPLDSEGALAFDGRRLFVVNAGSNSISEFAVQADGLTLLATAPSGGAQPVSLAVNHDLLYVLNEGDSASPGNISGLRVGDRGLTPIPDSSRPLSAAAVSAPEVSFAPSGDVLVVTEEATNLIDTYTIGRDGRANGPVSHASAGQTPFGFAFDPRGHLVVSDASASTAGAGALSSYLISRSGSLATISGSVADNQTAPCWVVTTDDGEFAYTSNTGSGTISSYTIGHDGSLALRAPDAASTGSDSAPADIALSRHSRFLYALASGTHAIDGFRVQDDGGLTPVVGAAPGLPAGATGLLAG